MEASNNQGKGDNDKGKGLGESQDGKKDGMAYGDLLNGSKLHEPIDAVEVITPSLLPFSFFPSPNIPRLFLPSLSHPIYFCYLPLIILSFLPFSHFSPVSLH